MTPFSQLMLQYFNNEHYEAEVYDKILSKYESASLKTTTSLSLLSFTQNAVFSVALTAVMVMASQGITQGTVSNQRTFPCHSGTL